MSFDEPPPGLLHRCFVEVAEAAADGDEIVIGQLEIAEEQDLMVEPRLMDLSDRLVIERAQIDADHLCPERGVHWFHPHRLTRTVESTDRTASTFTVGSI